VQRLPLELRAHGADDLGVAVARIEDAEPAEAIEILAALDVRECAAAVGPLDRGRRGTRSDRLAIFEKARINVLAEAAERLGRYPSRLLAIDRGGVDEI